MAFDVYKNAPGKEEPSHLPDFPTCVFICVFYCLWKLSQANTTPYLFGVVFWKRKGVISRQSAVMCELAKQVVHLYFGWGSMVSGLLDCEWETVTRDSGWVGSFCVWAVPAPALCLICLSIKTIIWPPLPDFVNISNARASAEYRKCVSCVVTLTMDHRPSSAHPTSLKCKLVLILVSSLGPYEYHAARTVKDLGDILFISLKFGIKPVQN